jgi:hypothetical protein
VQVNQFRPVFIDPARTYLNRSLSAVEAPHSLRPGFDKLSSSGIFKFKGAESISKIT